MSLSNTTTKVKYSGDGANTTFAITFDFILNASECQVILRDETVPTAITEVLLTDGVEYNLTGAAPPGIPFPTNVEMVVAPTATQELIVYRSMPLTQLLAYLETSEFRAESQELGLDKLTASIQEIAEELSRTPGVSIGTDANLPISYPEPVANEFIGWDDQGDDLKNYSAAEILSLALAGILLSANNLSDVADAPTSATNLGLGATSSVTHNDMTLVADLSAAGVDSSGRLEFETFLDTATIATPANPAAGRYKIYVKADGILYKLDSAGSEVKIGQVAFADDVFRIQDDGDATKEIAFQASGITTGTVRTITMPDTDIDLGDIAPNTAKVTFPEAPSDGTQYARKDAGWEVVAPGGNLWSDPVDANIVPDGVGTRGLGSFTNHFSSIIGKNLWAKDASPYMNFVDLANATFGRIRGKLTSISAVSNTFGMQAEGTGAAAATALALITSVNNAADAVPTIPILIETGNKTGGTGDSGDIRMTVGSSAGGTPGDFKLLRNGVAPTVGDVFTCSAVDGTGYWSTPVASGATTELDNLGTTAVNADLTMDATKTVILKNDVALKGRNAGNTTDNDIIKLNANDDVEVGARMVPAAATNDLGLPAQRFRTAYLSDTLYVGATASDGGYIADGVASTLLADTFAFFASQVSKAIALFTASSSTASITTGSVSVETGNAIGATANSGGINLQTGTATLNRGKISIKDGTEAGAGAGAVWTQAAADGIGGWSAPASGGDLWSDPVDANIVPDGIGTRGLGSFTNHFGSIIGKNMWAKDASPYMNFIDLSNATFGRIRGKLTSISAVSNTFGMQAEGGGAAAATALALIGSNSSVADAAATIPILIETGNKTAGTGNSGDIRMTIGTSLGGTPGDFKMLRNGVAPSIGDVFTCSAVDGTGYWSAPAAGGDLWSDPVDANIVPDGIGTRGLGSSTNHIGTIRQNLAYFQNGTASTYGQISAFAAGAPTPSGRTATFFMFNGGGGSNSTIGSFNTGGSVTSGAWYIETGTATGANSSGELTFITGARTSGDAAAKVTGDVTIGTGGNNGTNAAANSGNLNLIVGSTASGTPGEIKLLKSGVAPTVGDVFTCTNVDGSGYWAAAGGATTALDNLASVAINADLDPAAHNTRDLGTSGNAFKNINGVAFSFVRVATGVRGDILNTTTMDNGESVDIRLSSYTGAGNGGNNTNGLGLQSDADLHVQTIDTAVAATNESGYVNIRTGDDTSLGNSGKVTLLTGNSTGGASGEITLTTGTASTTRGSITMDALTIEHNQNPSTGFVEENGVTGSRPGSPVAAQVYFDTTLGIPIWYDGTNWIDATGTTV